MTGRASSSTPPRLRTETLVSGTDTGRYRRLPAEDLWSYLRATSGLPPHTRGRCTCNGGRRLRHGRPMCLSARSVAEICGVPRRQVERWKNYGPRVREAENIADYLGVHILEIWPSAYDGVTISG